MCAKKMKFYKQIFIFGVLVSAIETVSVYVCLQLIILVVICLDSE